PPPPELIIRNNYKRTRCTFFCFPPTAHPCVSFFFFWRPPLARPLRRRPLVRPRRTAGKGVERARASGPPAGGSDVAVAHKRTPGPDAGAGAEDGQPSRTGRRGIDLRPLRNRKMGGCGGKNRKPFRL